MALPEPTPGLVVRYSYLWQRQAATGEVSGRKIRPCAIVVAVAKHDDETIVYVAPITHSRPARDSDGVALPPAIKRRLGLDDEPWWVVATEVNAFVWPGPDLYAAAGDGFERSFVYGTLPEAIIEKVIESFRANVKLSRARIVKRTE